ncbi:hypothetical protein IWW34DRAFT_751751 [Fusarium oxysporum f. sp. albedinis]|nr:hypothetical protein IWW34DRAFT_751751 [Fusarium oxysporum f. sp. albedinis]
MSRNHVRNSYTLKLIFVAYVGVSWFEYTCIHVDGYGSLLLSDSVSCIGPDAMLLSLTTITGSLGIHILLWTVCRRRVKPLTKQAFEVMQHPMFVTSLPLIPSQQTPPH